MNTLREAAQQALEALLTYEQYIQPLTNYFGGPRVPQEGSASAKVDAAITALRAVLAQPDDWTRCHHCGQTMPPVPLGQAEPDLSRCPQCNGPADNGHDRSIPPSPYLCTKCMAEPAQKPVAWMSDSDVGFDKSEFGATPTVPLYTAPPKAKPALHQRVTYPELRRLHAQRDALLETLKYIAKQFRQHGRQHWPEAVAARLAIEAVEGEDK